MAATLCHSYMESQLVDSRIHRLILSSHRLSPKSLELCTENLGNETGSDIIESGIELLSSHSSECGDGEVSPGMIREKQKRKAREGRSFPPPLTTITGSESIRVRPHREGGRLVLQLIKVPSSFRAERSPGRLRLCFWTEMQHHHHHHIEDAVEDDQEDEVEKTQDHQHDDDVDVDVDVDDDDDGVDPENNECEWELFQKHTKERKQQQQVRVESTKFEWPSSRCKEEEHENINDLIIYWGEPVRLILISIYL
ncbi:protein FANTASTIC FOUR 3-like [Vigna umbellata]|uniref:protein FANTASTIC FOUR 3-like n=1 Tax=Vigna umbellata TaxID=87088 RepID=UPI001F5F3262|nr:protein FANTASTIC FOUR 3-like [Vigna umbellata]